MCRKRGLAFLSCGVISAVLACATTSHAELLGYWSANSPNDDFEVQNDFGNPDYVAVFEGDANYAGDMMGHTGLAGDNAMEFFGTDEDFAAVDIPDITYEEITIAGWLKGAQTGAWSGIFQTRDGSTPVGIGYNGTSGRLTYTWNDNNANSWDFPANTPNGDDLIIPEDEWTFVALSLNPDSATLFVGPKGEPLNSVTNEIPQLTQTPDGTGWRFGEDNCCGAERNFVGLMDDFALWNHALQPTELAQIHDGSKLPTDFLERAGGLRQVQVAGGSIGVASLSADLSDIVRSEPVETEGLAQFWYEGNMRANVEAFQDAGDAGSEANPLVAEPFASSTTWWAGSQSENVISDYPIPKYPDGLAGTRFDGSTNENNYGVRLTGEIFISGDGEYLIRDGIDDFTLIAIDQDGNGELDDFDSLTSADVGAAGFGDILVLDDDWANLDGGSQDTLFHGLADFENVGADGEWRKIEIWMSEGGGGDAAIVYMGSLDDPDIFDDTNGGALSQEERDAFVIRNDRLRSVVSVVESANASAEVRTGVEHIVQVSPDGSDQFAVDDNDGVYTTTLSVADAVVRIQQDGELADGTTLTIFDADNITGTDTLTLLFDDPSQWDLSNLASGQITFGTASGCNPNSQGDLDGNGTVEFADFLVMSANFGNAVGSHSEGDIDCNGTVEFADFLVLSANFGNAVAAESASVPEPSGLALLGIAGLLGSLLRRRRS